MTGKCVTDIVRVDAMVVGRDSSIMRREDASRRFIESVVVDQCVGHRAATVESADFQRNGLRIYHNISPHGVVGFGYLDGRFIKGHKLAHIFDEASLYQIVPRFLDGFPTHAPAAVHDVIQPAIVVAATDAQTYVVAAARQMVAREDVSISSPTIHREHESAIAAGL